VTTEAEITAVKIFTALVLGAYTIKLFTAVTNSVSKLQFLCQFVASTLVYYFREGGIFPRIYGTPL
jgi:ABC-type phosphate transport system permease subunit